MDLGVGSFVLANAVVSRQARDVSSGFVDSPLKLHYPFCEALLLVQHYVNSVQFLLAFLQKLDNWN